MAAELSTPWTVSPFVISLHVCEGTPGGTHARCDRRHRFRGLCLCLLLSKCGRSRHEWDSDQGGCGRPFARDAGAVLRPRLSQVLSAARHRSLCLQALLALEPGDRELTAIS